MIAAKGSKSKNRETLKELRDRHRDAGTQDIQDHEGQTALHKAVASQVQI